jgi:hypothetical protein
VAGVGLRSIDGDDRPRSFGRSRNKPPGSCGMFIVRSQIGAPAVPFCHRAAAGRFSEVNIMVPQPARTSRCQVKYRAAEGRLKAGTFFSA